MADASGDIIGPLAPQDLVTQAFVPTALGWVLQIYLSGSASTLVVQYMTNRQAQQAGFLTLNHILLAVCTAACLASTGMNMHETIHYMVSQTRSIDGMIDSYIPDDIFVTIPQGAAGLAAQIYFSRRCYKLIGNSRIFAIVITLPMLAAFAAAVTSAPALYIPFSLNDTLSVAEIWLWSTAATDLIIAGVLVVCMARTKSGFSSHTDDIISRIIRLALQTAVLPAFFAIVGAITFICTHNSESLYNVFTVFITFLPSIYLISFVHCLSWRATGTSNSQYQSSSANKIIVSMPSTTFNKAATLEVQHEANSKEDDGVKSVSHV